MQRIAIILFLLAAGVGIWFLITQDDQPSGEPELEGGTPPGRTDGDPEMAVNKGVPDNALPALKTIPTTARVLLIGQHHNTWPATMILAFDQIADLEYRTWFLEHMKTRTAFAGDGRGMAELKAKPDADYLRANDVQALFLDTFDPNVFPEAFWNTVTERVDSGAMGLYFRPSFLVGTGGEGVTQHPALTHPQLSALLPVAKAQLLQGTPPPGSFTNEQPLRVTTEGIQHPATRLVDNDTASAAAWGRTAEGDGRFGTKFVYPVTELKPGAQTLVELEAATRVPALIATAPESKRRVIWMGNHDFGQRTHHVRSKDNIQKLLPNHWVLWLIGR